MSDFTKLQALLDEQMSFPDFYTFKFIIKHSKKEVLLSALSDHSISEKLSKNGKYISISGRKLVQTSNEVIEIYLEVGKIEGIITL